MRVDANTVKGYATGRWSEILRSLAPHLVNIIDRGRRHGPCPLCEGTDRARCHNDFQETGGMICNQCKGGKNGLDVLMWANHCSFTEALGAVANYLGLGDGIFPRVIYRTPKPQPKKDWSVKRKQYLQVWNEAKPGTLRLRQYLEYRGLSIDLPATLRLHPSLEYWHGGRSYGKFPCMVTKIIRDCEVVGIHRTFLDSDGPGKAPVPEAKLSKKCADTITGAAIQLFEAQPNKPLALAEGIETALAVHEYSGWPVWSCVNSTMMEKVELPDNIKSVFIGADKDLSGAGQASAKKLSRRLVDEGRKVRISLPPTQIPDGLKSIDWLDYLNKEVTHV